MLSKKSVKRFAKSFTEAVELPDTTVSYHKGGIVGLCNKGLDLYYHFIKTTHDLVVVVTDTVDDNPKLHGRVLINLPAVAVTDGNRDLKDTDYQFKYAVRVLTDAIVTDFYSPMNIEFGRCMLYPKELYELKNGVMSVIVNSIKTRVTVFDVFNMELNGLLHYGIRSEPWHQSGIDLLLYRQGKYIVSTVRKIYDEDELRLKYVVCGNYDVNSLAELAKLVEDVLDAHKTLNY